MNNNYAILFPGQGCQYVGMGRFIKQSKTALMIFEQVNELLSHDLLSLILNGDLQTLTYSKYAQPAIVVMSYVAYCLLMEICERRPQCVAGHSLGEITALIASGVMSLSDGVRFIKFRSQLMDQAANQKLGATLLITDMTESMLTKLIDDLPSGYTAISAYNSPNQTIVGGSYQAINSLAKIVDKNGGEAIPFKLMPMKVDAPFHTALMSHLRQDIMGYLNTVRFSRPEYSIYSTVTGQLIQSEAFVKSMLVDQLTSPVLWNQVLTKIRQYAINYFIDIGPNTIIKNMVRENITLPQIYAFDDETDIKKIKTLSVGQGCSSYEAIF